MENNSQIIIYTTEKGDTKLDVRLENETVWLTQKLMAELFQTTIPNINMHLKNIFDEGELDPKSTIKDFLIVRLEGTREVNRNIEFYNLDAIISVGYRIKSNIATRFRQWATNFIIETKNLYMSSLRKVKKIKNATKTPKLQIPQNKDYQHNIFRRLLCFSVLVAKKRHFGLVSYIKIKKTEYGVGSFNLKLGTCIFTFLGLIFIFSCKNSEVDKANLVARVNDKYLYNNDLIREIPHYIKGNDSIEYVKNYISKWAKKNLMLKKAYINLSDDELFELEQQFEDYKNTLLVHRYEQKLISQKSDTSVSNFELESYYNEHVNEFKLDKIIIKPFYIKIKADNKNYNKIKNLTWSDEEDKKESLEELCINNADTFFFQNDWVDFEYINSLLPAPVKDVEIFIKYSKIYETQDSLYRYLLNIKELKTKNEIAPLSFISGQLKSLIQNRKKILLIKETENNLYEDAVRTKNFETYK